MKIIDILLGKKESFEGRSPDYWRLFRKKKQLIQKDSEDKIHWRDEKQ